VISDISGLTGPAIVRAIVAGERDTQELAALSHPRIQARQEEIAQSLQGNWRPEVVFVVQQEVDMYDTYQKRIVECDQQLQKQLASLMSLTPPGIGQTQKPPNRSRQPLRMRYALTSAANCSVSRAWTLLALTEST
jgi:transposase